MTNYPNCGAPIAGLRCEYCGTDLGRKDELDRLLEERGRLIIQFSQQEQMNMIRLAERNITWKHSTKRQ